MIKIFGGESKTIVGAAAVVGGLSLVSRLVGLVRDRILLGRFGAGDALDAYYAAFRLPDLLFGLLVVGSLSAGFIPIFTKHYRSPETRERAWRFASNALNLIAVTMAAISILLFVGADALSGLIAPGFGPEKRALVAEMTRVMLLAQVLLAMSVVFGSVLQGIRRFLLFSLAPIFYNVGIIAGALWFVDRIGSVGLAWGVVFGALLHLLVQFAGASGAGFRWRPVFFPGDPDARELVRMTGPRMVGIAVNQLNFVALTVMATTLAVGSVTVFQVAYNIQFFAIGVFGVSYAIAVFPSFVEDVEHGDARAFVATFSGAVRQVLFFLVPLSALFLTLRAQIVRVVAGAGLFDWHATVLAADTLAFFTLSLVTQSLAFVLARAFFAYRDTATPLAAGLASSLVSLLAALWLAPRMGVAGLAAAYSLASMVNLALLWVPLRVRAGGSLDEARIFRALACMIAGGIACAAAAQALKHASVAMLPNDTFHGILTQGALAGSGGLAAYAFVCYALGSGELASLSEGLRRRLLRKASPGETVPTDTTAI